MNDRRGITTGVRPFLGYSKRDLLLLDSLRIMGLESQLRGALDHDPELVANIEYLAEQGFIDTAPETPFELGTWFLDSDFRRQVTELRLAGHDDLIGEDLHSAERMASSGRHPSSRVDHPLPSAGAALIAWALTLDHEPAVPLLERPLGRADWQEVAMTGVIVPRKLMEDAPDPLLDITLKEVPIPGPEVPLEAVLAFVLDAETRRRRERLLLAIQRAELEGRTPADWQLQIAESLNEFRSHMALADMRATTTKIRVAIDATLGLVDELLHLRPGKAVEGLFEYRKLRTERFAAELAAPGGEVAFIYEAERRFGAT